MKHLFYALLLAAFIPSMSPAAPKKVIKQTLINIDDTVRRLDPAGDDIIVLFKKHAAQYRLKKSLPEFNVVMAQLSQSHASRTVVHLKVDANTLEIKGLAQP